MTYRIGIVVPPKGGFTSRLVHLRGSPGHSKAEIESKLAGGEWRESAVPDDPPVFVLVEAKMDETADEVAGLRVAPAHSPLDLFGDRILRPGFIVFGVA